MDIENLFSHSLTRNTEMREDCRDGTDASYVSGATLDAWRASEILWEARRREALRQEWRQFHRHMLALHHSIARSHIRKLRVLQETNNEKGAA